MPDEYTSKLAVLIDADNAQPAIIEDLLAEIAKYGTASVKRIYGDWTGTHLKGWKEVLLLHSIQPIQQFRYTVGKNATDAAMIIDAMDLLYTEKFDGFCIVSSDSDFTKLASRIRESGLVVYGFGEKKTPEPFVSACDKFIYTEVLVSKPDAASPTIKRKTTQELKQNTKLISLIRNAVEQGRQAVQSIVNRHQRTTGDQIDLVIVGAGPAGLSAALAAKAPDSSCTM